MQAEADGGSTGSLEPPSRVLGVAALVVAALFFLLALTAYLTDLGAHSGALLGWYDLNVYNDSGLIARQLPAILYSWQYTVGVKFTYTPFAAILFAGGTFLPWTALRWTMTVASLISIPLTVWLTLSAMGRRGVSRLSAVLVVSAIALWTEPVVKSLFLGQIEPLLMLLVVADLTLADGRRWKGAGVGLAAGIKLVPLIFIPYLMLSGKMRQAAIATATFAATVALGFALLPGESSSYWLTGYFFRPGRTGGVDSLVNQSLLGVIARQAGGGPQAQPTWLPVVLAVALLGLVGGALLSRSGKPVQGWVLVGITSVLVSPISWDHHWVWIVPFLAMLAGLAMTARGAARWGCWFAFALTAAAMGSWPWRWSGPQAFVPGRGLLGWFVQPPEIYQVTTLHGWEFLTWNLFVVVGALAYLGILAGVWPTWRNRPRQGRAGPPGPTSVEPLLARADAVLDRDGPRAPAGMQADGSPTVAGPGGGRSGRAQVRWLASGMPGGAKRITCARPISRPRPRTRTAPSPPSPAASGRPW